MISRKGKILVELARVVERYGADEVLALARAMRDPSTMNDLAELLERVTETVSQNSRKTKEEKPRSRGHGKITPAYRGAVRTALQEGYPTLESLGGLFDRLKIDRKTVATVEDAHRSILAHLDKVADPDRIKDDIIEGSIRLGGELGRLTDAIVSKPKR